MPLLILLSDKVFIIQRLSTPLMEEVCLGGTKWLGLLNKTGQFDEQISPFCFVGKYF